MDPIHRKRIDKYCDLLVNNIDIVTIWPFLIRNKIFNRDDHNIPLWLYDITNPSTIEDIILAIKTRCPLAYQNFILSLRQSGQGLLAEILDLIE